MFLFLQRSWAKLKCKHVSGQNLLELAFTFPMVIVLMFFIVEVGRVWFAYEGAKMAANEGAHAASMYHNPHVGKALLDKKLAATGLKVGSAQVNQIPNQHAYQASVTVQFKPLFGGLSIPSLGGNLTILPSSFNISYSAVDESALY